MHHALRGNASRAALRYGLLRVPRIAVMVDDLYGDRACLGFVEWAARCAVETAPCRFINIGAQGAFQFVIGFFGSGEVGMAQEKTLAVVVGVDEPAGDVVGGGAAKSVRWSDHRHPRP